MRIITAIQKIITAPGERWILEPASSLNLVSPPPLEGIDILLSAMVFISAPLLYTFRSFGKNDSHDLFPAGAKFHELSQ